MKGLVVLSRSRPHLVLLASLVVASVVLAILFNDRTESISHAPTPLVVSTPVPAQRVLASPRSTGESREPQSAEYSAISTQQTEADWMLKVKTRPDLIYSLVPEDKILEDGLFPSRAAFEHIFGQRLELARSLTVGQLLENLPRGHPFWNKHPAVLLLLDKSPDSDARITDIVPTPSDVDLSQQWDRARDRFALALQWHVLRRHVDSYSHLKSHIALTDYFDGRLFSVIGRILPPQRAADIINALYAIETATLLRTESNSVSSARSKALAILTAEYNAADALLTNTLDEPIGFLATVGIVAGTLEVNQFRQDDPRWNPQ
jgi:hypothetical protein